MALAVKENKAVGLTANCILIRRDGFVDNAIALARRHGKHHAVVFLDLDGFKHINDSLGHPIGDELPQSVAQRLVACLRGSDKEMNVRAVERQFLEGSLRRALERREFVLHYQPKINLETGAIAGAEALIRWRHPERGLIAPALFVPIAEDCGLIVPIGRWVLHEACRQAQAWIDAGLPPLTIAVNISAVEMQSKDFLEGVRATLGQTRLHIQFSVARFARRRDQRGLTTLLAQTARLHMPREQNRNRCLFHAQAAGWPANGQIAAHAAANANRGRGGQFEFPCRRDRAEIGARGLGCSVACALRGLRRPRWCRR